MLNFLDQSDGGNYVITLVSRPHSNFHLFQRNKIIEGVKRAPKRFIIY